MSNSSLPLFLNTLIWYHKYDKLLEIAASIFSLTSSSFKFLLNNKSVTSMYYMIP